MSLANDNDLDFFLVSNETAHLNTAALAFDPTLDLFIFSDSRLLHQCVCDRPWSRTHDVVGTEVPILKRSILPYG